MKTSYRVRVTFTNLDDENGEVDTTFLPLTRSTNLVEALGEGVMIASYWLSTYETMVNVTGVTIEPSPVEIINGCEVIDTVAGAKIIHHPLGYMVYRTARVGTRKTMKGAVSLAERTAP